jgi:hypothetical protein
LSGADFTVKVSTPKHTDDTTQITPIYWHYADNLLNHIDKKDAKFSENLKSRIVDINLGLDSYEYFTAYQAMAG